MKVTVKLFASFREAAGTSQSVVDVEPGTTVGQLWDRLGETYPRLQPMKRIAAFAVNGQHSPAGSRVSDGDEVAFLPPVSGG